MLKRSARQFLDIIQKSPFFRIYGYFLSGNVTINLAGEGELKKYAKYLYPKKQVYNPILEQHRKYFLALSGNKPVGRVMLQFIHGKEQRDFCKIYSLKVNYVYRNRGIAARLIKTAEDFAAQSGFNKIFLTTSTHNYKAAFFYRKHGWKTLSESELTPFYAEEMKTYSQKMVAFEKELRV